MQYLALASAAALLLATSSTTQVDAFPANCRVKSQRTKVAAACVDWKTYTSCIPASTEIPKILAPGQKASDLVGKQWCATAGYAPNHKTNGLNWGVCYTAEANTLVSLGPECLFGFETDDNSTATTAPSAEAEVTLAPSTAGSTGNTFPPSEAPTPEETAAPTPEVGQTTQAPTNAGETAAPTSGATTDAPTGADEEESSVPTALATSAPITRQPTVTLPPVTRAPTAPTSAATAGTVASASLAVVVTGLAAFMA